MSERPPLYPPHVRPVPVDQVLRDIESAEQAVGRLAHDFVGDDNQRVRQWVMAMVGEIRRMGDAVRIGDLRPDPAGVPVQPQELPARPMGEHTREVQSRVTGNRGHAWPQ